MVIEFEVKFYINLEDFYIVLKNHRAKKIKNNILMKRIVFEVPENKNSSVRVRDEGDLIRLSYKSYDSSKMIDSQQEVDVIVDDFDKSCEILALLGMVKMRHVQNYREIWRIDDCLIMIDQWPALEPFIEIEGPSKESVENVAYKLGFSMDHAIYGPTAKLYEQVYGLTRDQFEKIAELTFQIIPEVLQKD